MLRPRGDVVRRVVQESGSGFPDLRRGDGTVAAARSRAPSPAFRPAPGPPNSENAVRPRRAPAFLLSLALLLAACGDGEPDEPDEVEQADDVDGAEDGGVSTDDDVDVDDGNEGGDEPAEPEVDPADVDANELGEVPVLMYHRILPDGGSEYDLTPEEFREELQYLYDNDYRPIRTDQFVSGDLDVPAGTTPVVLTFDDSTREQFTYDDDGEIDPDTAVGIMLDFAEEHDDFDATGSFYVLGSLFGVSAEDGADKLRHLHELGFELGNHTLTHERLDRLDAEGIQRELAQGAENVTDAVDDAEVTTMSLPLGIWPEDRELAARGSYDGYEYEHDGILLVGSNPSPSPFHAEFDGLAIPRIRSLPMSSWDADAQEDMFTSGYWFDVFEQSPERRYVSDGNPDTISFPEELGDQLSEEHEDRANPY
jgi:peptidoglycan/xylan/chitin deacetylase (PgdA/CDA1 family)